jgi:5-methylcytosine-specific restriction endonuclease McrA
MPRKVAEWHGKSDDTPIPPRVKLRIFDRYDQRCGHCNLLIVGKLLPQYDHIVALINGGANRESNIRLLCSECHKVKSAGDVRIKSVTNRKRSRRLKIHKRNLIPGSKGSGWKKTFNHGWVKR